ncbi:PQQ-binding-like beta-propeller repeat protein [Sphingomonas sp. BIUV-7]|uniref:PQQ-binding-like beta-propeller repeat protein n=1 Tax=Sphingomonas natans TaxID=3063330 RepID=A0ABT8Y7Q3_9SPHN|nr:PQQ-binding-like beta-propeller repeat protein [Sphingomonas sp. BIUV-7]MDO6414042.1 PQQ-binding-like beta-propeller repeat protein [Sphingomonas sp. BIUV-7]
MRSLLIWLAVLVGLAGGAAVADPPAGLAVQNKRGQDVYQRACAACHDQPESRAPSKAFLTQTRSPEYILRALTVGAMREITADVSLEDKKAVATYLIGRAPSTATDLDSMANRCKAAPAPLTLAGSGWNGWGAAGVTNARYQADPGFTAAQIPRLKLKWAFAYPVGVSNEPTVVGGRVFVSNMAGITFSLDARTGCTIWARDLAAPMRTMIVLAKLPSGKIAAFTTGWYGDMHALDAETGQVLWHVRPEDHRAVRLTGSPTYYKGTLYMGFSSGEEVLAADPKYVCCTFQGSVAAVDAATGRTIWKTGAIDQPVAPIAGTRRQGPSGAAVWHAPTIDEKRQLLYVTTGDDYSDPGSDASDAVVAFDLATGKKRWVSQVIKNDIYVSGCDAGTRHGNCPAGEVGPDHDFGASPLLVRAANGKDIVVALNKNGVVYGMDPDRRGAIVWQARLGRGGKLGGIEWGGATDGKAIYVPIADTGIASPVRPGDDMAARPGINAIAAADGKLLWHSPAPKPACSWIGACANAYSAAVAAMPGAVFAGSWDGHIRAYATNDGALVWDFDTGRSFDGVNGTKSSGGTIDHGAQTIAGGMIFVNSGGRYGQPGNALLAFSIDGK